MSDEKRKNFEIKEFCPDFDRLDWFNISAPVIRINRTHIWLWNAFSRAFEDDHSWGFGILQIDYRHLFYVGSRYTSVLFLRVNY